MFGVSGGWIWMTMLSVCRTSEAGRHKEASKNRIESLVKGSQKRVENEDEDKRMRMRIK